MEVGDPFSNHPNVPLVDIGGLRPHIISLPPSKIYFLDPPLMYQEALLFFYQRLTSFRLNPLTCILQATKNLSFEIYINYPDQSYVIFQRVHGYFRKMAVEWVVDQTFLAYFNIKYLGEKQQQKQTNKTSKTKQNNQTTK